MPTRFKELVKLAGDLESTTKINEKKEYIANFLNRLEKDEISPAVLLIVGEIFPESDSRSLDVGWKTISHILEGGQQTSLIKIPLTIKRVYRILEEIAEAKGTGSRLKKQRLLEGLISETEKDEREILFRIIFGDMRIGVNEGLMLAGIAEAVDAPLNLLRRALMFTGDIGEVAETAISLGVKGLKEIKVHIFVPLKPMLANMADEAIEVIGEHGGKTAFEYKFDGARIQIHREFTDIKIFSRRLSDVSESLPDIIELVLEKFEEGRYILEGEVTAVGPKGKPLPFQDLMRRFGRIQKVDEMMKKIPLQLYLFDILLKDDKLLIDESYSKRWKILSNIIPEEYLTRRIITDDPEKAKQFLMKAVEDGHEGLMAKRLDGKYTPGARGKSWLKMKPIETLDVIVVAADWGSGRRRGWLSNYHLAVRENDDYLIIGKTFKGLTDDQFEWMTKRLKNLKTSETEYTVKVIPKLVLEVAFNEIQTSPTYPSGYALRFARVKRIREDKSPKDTDTLDRVKELYEKQFRYKDKLKLE